MNHDVAIVPPSARPWLLVSILAGALAFVGSAVIVTPTVQAVRGEIAAWEVVVPIGIVSIVVLALLAWLLGSITPSDAAAPAPRHAPTYS